MGHVAWNRGATVMLGDYGALPPDQRNVLRIIFLDPRVRAVQYDWESVARTWWGRSVSTPRVPGRRRRWGLWSKNSAGSAPSSEPCGATTTFAARVAKRSSTYATGSRPARLPIFGLLGRRPNPI